MQQRWSCCELVSKWEIVGYGALLSSYSRDLCFSHDCTPVRLYYPPMYIGDLGGSGASVTPDWGCGGQRAPEAKNQVVFAHGFYAHCIIVPVLELLVLGVGKHYIFVSWLCILYRVVL